MRKTMSPQTIQLDQHPQQEDREFSIPTKKQITLTKLYEMEGLKKISLYLDKLINMRLMKWEGLNLSNGK